MNNYINNLVKNTITIAENFMSKETHGVSENDRSKKAFAKLLKKEVPNSIEINSKINLDRTSGYEFSWIKCFSNITEKLDKAIVRTTNKSIANGRICPFFYRVTSSNLPNHECGAYVPFCDSEDAINGVLFHFNEAILNSIMDCGISVKETYVGKKPNPNNIEKWNVFVDRNKNHSLMVNAFIAKNFDEIKSKIRILINGVEAKVNDYARILLNKDFKAIANKCKDKPLTIEIFGSKNSYAKLEMILGKRGFDFDGEMLDLCKKDLNILEVASEKIVDHVNKTIFKM